MPKKLCKADKKKKIKINKYKYECNKCGLKADKEKKLCKSDEIEKR
ncbi:hypothetical protein ACFLSE_05875 [Bacteroidota bacterium]